MSAYAYVNEPAVKPGSYFLLIPYQSRMKESWNMEFDGNDEDQAAYEKYEEEYFSKKWETKTLRICNYGCGVFLKKEY